MDFNRDLIIRNLQLGYYDTMKLLKRLKGRKYYIIPEDEEKVFEIFRSLPDMLVRELGKLFNTKEMTVKRMLFERIIPEIADLLGLKAASEYQDILIGLLEYLAEESGVERFRINFKGKVKAECMSKGRY